MPSAKELAFKYYFMFEDGTRATYEIYLDRETLHLKAEQKVRPSTWTKLEHHKCSNCPLNNREHTHCPLALNLSTVVPRFSKMFSYEKVNVLVETETRTYSKNTTLQSGLSSMLGIYMVTAGCPIMDRLRPMVRFHLPFATIEETVFRSVSTYLLGQYFEHKKGRQPDLTLKGLMDGYKQIQMVNHGMAGRMRSIVDKDANLNALVVLDVFAKELPFSIESSLENLEYLFTPAPV